MEQSSVFFIIVSGQKHNLTRARYASVRVTVDNFIILRSVTLELTAAMPKP